MKIISSEMIEILNNRDNNNSQYWMSCVPDFDKTFLYFYGNGIQIGFCLFHEQDKKVKKYSSVASWKSSFYCNINKHYPINKEIFDMCNCEKADEVYSMLKNYCEKELTNIT